MIDSVKFVIAFNDLDLEPEEREVQAQQLMTELTQMDEVESVDKVSDLNPSEGSKAFGSFLMGILTTKVSLANGRKLLRFLSDRLGNKPIERISGSGWHETVGEGQQSGRTGSCDQSGSRFYQ